MAREATCEHCGEEFYLQDGHACEPADLRAAILEELKSEILPQIQERIAEDEELLELYSSNYGDRKKKSWADGAVSAGQAILEIVQEGLEG